MTTTTTTNGHGSALVPAATSLVPQNLQQLYTLAGHLAASQLVPKALHNRPSDVAVVVMTGLELGLSPMQALRLIYVWNGKPSLSADLIVALVKRSPACRYFRLLESSAKQAVYETLREGEPEPTRMAFTLEQARVAGLVTKDVWRSYPEPMLRARAAAYLARAVYPDVVGGIYTEDEGAEIRERDGGEHRAQAARQTVDDAETTVVREPDAPPPIPPPPPLSTEEQEFRAAVKERLPECSTPAEFAALWTSLSDGLRDAGLTREDPRVVWTWGAVSGACREYTGQPMPRPPKPPAPMVVVDPLPNDDKREPGSDG